MAEDSRMRMEDHACVAGDYLIYVSTKQRPLQRRNCWTALYRTHLETGDTLRLTPPGIVDFSPAASPSGRKIAVATLQRRGGVWEGEIEDLQTDIYIFSIDRPSFRRMAVENGGWPTWGSEDVLFFHRKVGEGEKGRWGVFRADVRGGRDLNPVQVTPPDVDAVTPAALDADRVAVAIIRKKSTFADFIREEDQYRHIEIFDSSKPSEPPIAITRKINPKSDHYNPFVIDGGKRIGYHRCQNLKLELQQEFDKIEAPHEDLSLFRVSGVFPTFSPDGSKLAFVDNTFKSVWIADAQGLRKVLDYPEVDTLFAPCWNQHPEIDTLYVCKGRSFHADERVDIVALQDVTDAGAVAEIELTNVANNAFPFTSPDGKRLVFRSTRSNDQHPGSKNLYIMEDPELGDYGDVTQLTDGPWTDTHCQWSAGGQWIAFSSTRHKPAGAPDTDNGLDPGYFGVYLINPDTKATRRVLHSASNLAGHVNHPFFSPDGKSLVFTADLAGVSVEPISMPLFLHSVRAYGDIFMIDVDETDDSKFVRLTHSRYENSTAAWTKFATSDPRASWRLLITDASQPTLCPYRQPDGGESWNLTGHLCITKRCC